MRNIYLTVDIECHDIKNANLYVYGYDGKYYWGLRTILELGREVNIPINFFVDVGEELEYGEKFMLDIIDLIREYRQPVFFHLHPDYISGDHKRTFLWEYSYHEKKKIFNTALNIYTRYAKKQDRLVFRAGRYGVDLEFYDILAEKDIKILDLSYLGGSNKMCHLGYHDIGVYNKGTVFKGIEILPNTRFIVLDFVGIKRAIGLDTADTTFYEFKEYLRQTKLSNIVLTMHSWNFIRKWFFLPGRFVGDKSMVKKFYKYVNYAKNNGFQFANLENYTYAEDQDEMINMCKGFRGKIVCLVNNFIRFQKIGRLNKKYFVLYILFYLLLLLAIIFTILLK